MTCFTPSRKRFASKLAKGVSTIILKTASMRFVSAGATVLMFDTISEVCVGCGVAKTKGLSGRNVEATVGNS